MVEDLMEKAPAWGDEQTRLLGKALLTSGTIDQAGLHRALRVADGAETTLPAALAQLGLAPEEDLARAIAEISGRPLVGAAELLRSAYTTEMLSSRFLEEHRVVPYRTGDGALWLAMADPFDAFTRNAVRLAIGETFDIAVAAPEAIEAAQKRFFGEAALAPEVEFEDSDEEVELTLLKDLASGAPVVKLVDTLIARAVEARASDIHLEPTETGIDARYRIDGVLCAAPDIPARMKAAVVSRIKIIAGLDIAERRLPQDGRVKTTVRGRAINLRVSTLPILHGESVVIRVLDRDRVALDFDALGLTGAAQRRVKACLSRPNGIFLVTGPTGSGKTTTLYAALTALHSAEKKMLTVEDPVEYQIAGVNQVQVRHGIGLDFARVLRSILRHDPDVIMIGEIRDAETARIAAQSALTGHLVLSTLHTNDAAGAITRLVDMELEPFLLTATLSGVAAQRLVRRLCEKCKEPYPITAPMAEELGVHIPMDDQGRLWKPVGCEACGGAGYRGRVMIVETLQMSDRLRDLVLRREGIDALRGAAIEEGMTSLFEDGVAKALSGLCSIEDVFAAARFA